MPMRTTKSFILMTMICAAASSAVGCTAEAPSVHTAGLSTAPFSQYLTFSFGPEESSPPGTSPSSHAAEVRKQARSAITSELIDKGYVVVEGKSDLTVMCGTGRRSSTVVRRPSHADWLDEDEDVDFATGALVIDMFDGANGGQIWHGASRAAVDPDRIDINVLKQSVKDVLASFPNARRRPEIVAARKSD